MNTRSMTVSAMALFATMGLGGCSGVAPMSGDTGEEQIGEVSQQMAVTETLATGSSKTESTCNSSNCVCYLTSVSGNFSSEGSVSVVHFGDHWKIASSSGASGTAACISVPNGSWIGNFVWDHYSDTDTWNEISQEYSDHMVPNGTNTSCVVTKVSGKMQSGNDRFRFWVYDHKWFYGGRAASGNMHGEGYCFKRLPAPSFEVPDALWVQGFGPTTMASGSNLSCGLSGLQGKFNGSGESVRAEVSTGTYAWRLTGSSQQTGVAAWGICQ